MSARNAPLYTLSAGQAHTLSARAGAVLKVIRGQVWLTESGQAEDVFLHAGDSWTVGRGRTVVQALEGLEAQFSLMSPQALALNRPERLPQGLSTSAPAGG